MSIAEWECPRRWEGAAKAQEDEEVKQGGLGSESLLSRVLRAITCLALVLCAYNLETMPMEA